MGDLARRDYTHASGFVFYWGLGGRATVSTTLQKKTALSCRQNPIPPKYDEA